MPRAKRVRTETGIPFNILAWIYKGCYKFSSTQLARGYLGQTGNIAQFLIIAHLQIMLRRSLSSQRLLGAERLVGKIAFRGNLFSCYTNRLIPLSSQSNSAFHTQKDQFSHTRPITTYNLRNEVYHGHSHGGGAHSHAEIDLPVNISQEKRTKLQVLWACCAELVPLQN